MIGLNHNTPEPWALPCAVHRELGEPPWILVVVIGQLVVVFDDAGITVSTAASVTANARIRQDRRAA